MFGLSLPITIPPKDFKDYNSLSLLGVNVLQINLLKGKQDRIIIDFPLELFKFDNNIVQQAPKYKTACLAIRLGKYAKVEDLLEFGKSHSLNNMCLTNDLFNGLGKLVKYYDRFPIIPNLQTWWCINGRWLTCDNKCWDKIKISWEKINKKPIVIVGLPPWSLISWSLGYKHDNQQLNLFKENDSEVVPLNYLTLPNLVQINQRVPRYDLTQKASGIWHLGLLDKFIGYLDWADVLFDVAEGLNFLPHLTNRLQEMSYV